MDTQDTMAAPDSFADKARDSSVTTTVHRNGDIVVIEIGGEVDMLSAPLLRETVTASLHDHPRVLVLDLCAVRFFGSAGLTVLIEAQQLAGERTLLRMVGDGPTIRRPLHITGLDRQFALYATRDDALRDV